MSQGCDRRTFLKGGLVVSTVSGSVAAGRVFAFNAAQTAEPSESAITRRPLGKTGREVSIYGLGGLYTVSMHDRHAQAVEIVNRAIDLGINYIDTSALYGTGAVSGTSAP